VDENRCISTSSALTTCAINNSLLTQQLGNTISNLSKLYAKGLKERASAIYILAQLTTPNEHKVWDCEQFFQVQPVIFPLVYNKDKSSIVFTLKFASIFKVLFSQQHILGVVKTDTLDLVLILFSLERWNNFCKFCLSKLSPDFTVQFLLTMCRIHASLYCWNSQHSHSLSVNY